MKRLKAHPQGITIIELMVSMTIGLIVILSVFSVIHMSTKSYKATVAQVQESTTAQDALRIIRQDLMRASHRLPLSLGVGRLDRGWDSAIGHIREWSNTTSGYGMTYIRESNQAWPSDRLGFYTTLPDDLSQQYGGKNLAHVLYFTAMAPLNTPEVLGQTETYEGTGYSRNLYRYYTPPDLVFTLLNQGYNDDLKIIPRGPHYLIDSEEGSPSVLSLVMANVAQFNITVSASYTTEHLVEEINDLGVFLAEVNHEKLLLGSGKLHTILSQDQLLDFYGIRPRALEVKLLVVPPSLAKTLTFDDWNMKVDSHSLGRNEVVLSEHRALFPLPY